jgi:serine/threonine protein kinase/Tol biopolymer transport system component
MLQYIRTMVGKIIAHYHIVEKLGEGGMGVVYKARDTHLDRFVALKVLPPEKMADPERRRRFVQEAKAASALNHPNIITIHDITHAAGLDLIVMEFVAGKTLDAYIGHRGMRPNECLAVSIQIAGALAAAHSAGIIHRDLKPSNVMLTGHPGLVKVLDFGLAKLTEPREADEFLATETLAAHVIPHTEEGVLLGTIAYMSPEQAEGRTVDGRSDIFSLGSVIYEMTTGRRAFRGETRASTLAAILRDEPPAISQVSSVVPQELERIVARCMRKDPQRRFQHMDDLKVALEELKEESDSGRSAPAPRRRTISAPAVACAVILALAAAGVTWWLTHRASPGPNRMPVLRRLTSDPSLTTEPALSPDGKLVAYASDRAGEGKLDIWLQQLAGGEPVRLTHGAGDDREPAFSPDGSKIAFRSDREGGGIYVISTVGGTERKIAERGRRPRFSPDGRTIAYWMGEQGGGQAPGKLYVIPADSGATEMRPELPVARNPVWSPDGKSLLFECADSVYAGRGYDWCVASADGKTMRKTGAVQVLQRQHLIPAEIGQLSELPVPGAWLDQRVVFSATLANSTNLWQIPIAPKTFQIAGPAQRLTSATAMDGEPSIANPGSGGQSPLVVFSSLTENVDIWSVPMDTNRAKVTNEPRRLTQDLASDIRPSISGDGKKLVFNSNRSGNWDVWIKDLDSGKEMPLVATPADEQNPKISLDGSKVIYSVSENNKQATYVLSSGGGLPKKVCDDCYAWTPSSDGKRMPFVSWPMIKILDFDTARKTDILKLRLVNTGSYRMSWDGRWLVFYGIVDAGHTVMFIAPIREGAVTDQSEFISVTDGSTFDIVPEMSPDGNLLYFLSDRDTRRCLWAQRLDPATKYPVGPAFPVQHFHRASLSPIYVKGGQRAISVARDKIVLTVAEHLGNIWMTELGNQ